VVECLSYGGHWVSNDRLFLLLRYYLLQNEIRGGAAYSFAPAWGGIREAGGYRSWGGIGGAARACGRGGVCIGREAAERVAWEVEGSGGKGPFARPSPVERMRNVA